MHERPTQTGVQVSGLYTPIPVHNQPTYNNITIWASAKTLTMLCNKTEREIYFINNNLFNMTNNFGLNYQMIWLNL